MLMSSSVAQAPGEIENIREEKVWGTRPNDKPIPDIGSKPFKVATNVSKPTVTVCRPVKYQDTGAAT
jgi:hypothetical protein